MNADLKRVRESGLEDGVSPAKRRALSNATAPPFLSEDEEPAEEWMKVVELRRKEAIYRQMLEYRRSYQEEARRVKELEAQRRVLEASVQAVEVCWNQLVTAMDDLAGQEGDLQNGLEPILEPGLGLQELQQALDIRLPATKHLIQRFTKLAPNGARSSSDLESRCQKLQVESSALRSNSLLLKSQISSLSEGRAQLQKDLQKAQKALDRQRMEHDKAETEWRESRDRGSATPTVKANGSGNATPNGKVDEDVKVTINDGAAASGMLQDNSDLEQLAESRRQQLEALHSEYLGLKQEADHLRLMSSHPTEAMLRESPFFQVYLQQLATSINRANALQAQFQEAEARVDELKNHNFDFRQAVLDEARQEVEALRQQSSKKDIDLARLRGQRDDMNADLTERKMREAERTRYAEETEALAQARAERITYLSSEVKRLKGKLAAKDGSEGYLSFLRGDGGIDGDYLKELEAKLSEAQNRLSSSPDTESGAELAAAKRALSRYERVLGPNPEAAEDVTALSERLQMLEKEKRDLSLQLSEAENATNALYTEVEGLSKLWEGLEAKVNSKIYELKDGEQKMLRLTTEKAKADNKYFQAMRSKEAIEAECKAAQRSVEKQLKLLERAQEVERGLNVQISAHEKGLTAIKNTALELQTQLATVTSEKVQLELRLQQSQAALIEAQTLLQTRVAEATSEKSARIKLQEELEASQKTAKRLKDRQDAATSLQLSASEVQLKEDRDKLWVSRLY
ncbi:BRE1 E3 ubiquitin ligase-domain-containing protein [Naematelia encephala]|uniref:E3 ubiquitin protein ligase n=1 Tax=Naematelia encephala TaxID=71784 RepID=A0A1Y2BFY5_9TREE|nr:BRE1 E3 ubiquitin ligase-domain-containing protein [Naematelia encephala]